MLALGIQWIDISSHSPTTLFGWVAGVILFVMTWVLATGLRAIVGEYVKRWFFNGLKKKVAPETELEDKKTELAELEARLEAARLAIEGRVLRRWSEQEIEIQRRRAKTAESGPKGG